MKQTTTGSGTDGNGIQMALTRTFVCLAAAAAVVPAVIFHIADRPAAIGTAFAMAAIVLVAATGFHIVSRRLAETLGKNNGESPATLGETCESMLNAHLRSAVFSLADGFILWDSDDRMVIHNGRVGLRSTPALRAGTPFRNHVAMIFPDIDEATTGGDLDNWIQTRLAWHAEAAGSHEILMKSGRWVLMTERRADDGSTVVIYTDITDRKNAERHLKISERRLAHAQKLAAFGIWEWNTVSGEMYWSDVLYRILGIPEDAEPMSLDQYLMLVHPTNRDLVRSTFRRLVSTGGQYNQEYQIIRPDGEIRTVRTEAEAVKDADGRIVRVLAAVHDISETRSAERNLRRAKELADHANHAKSEFLANVSHELRTPLNAIIGFSEVLLQEVFGPIGNDRYREYAGDIRQSGTHLLGVINDLLDYSKLEAGHLELHLETVSAGTTIENVVRLLRERAESQSVSLNAETDGFNAEIEADERKLTQILFNLISNAIKFTPAGGVVTVHAEEFDRYVDISVTDTGIGMNPDDIALALAPFGQVDSSLNRQHTGTGLGLPLSRALAELHGGSLHIESVPWAGTTVRIRLPKPDAPDKDAPDEPALCLVMDG